jgi:hypothetical protein
MQDEEYRAVSYGQYGMCSSANINIELEPISMQQKSLYNINTMSTSKTVLYQSPSVLHLKHLEEQALHRATTRSHIHTYYMKLLAPILCAVTTMAMATPK